MIARDSVSFPYLAVAQHYGVPYRYVLQLAEDCFEGKTIVADDPIDKAVQAAWLFEQARRTTELRPVKVDGEIQLYDIYLAGIWIGSQRTEAQCWQEVRNHVFC